MHTVNLNSTPLLPPTPQEERIRREVKLLFRQILGRTLSMKEEHRIDDYTPKMMCSACHYELPIGYLHQCLYCKALLCEKCGEKHFGQSRKGWMAEREGAQTEALNEELEKPKRRDLKREKIAEAWRGVPPYTEGELEQFRKEL